jgi:hypothetical protein
MPSLTIVHDIQSILESKLKPIVPDRWKHQFDFGIKAFSLREFNSANGNARMIVPNANTASTKCDRLLANKNLANLFGKVFDTLELINQNSFVNIDHTDMNGLAALVGAVQTKNGRAIPCLVEATYSGFLPAHKDAFKRKQMLRKARADERKEITFTDHTITTLKSLHERLGFWPKLVFDRGFGGTPLVSFLYGEKAIFYARLKAGRFVRFAGQELQVKQLSSPDSQVTILGMKLRVIRSEKPKDGEPWYILTSDFNSSREEIIKIYYHRFEIEETFRDIKHIFELKRTRLNKPNSLKVILWLVSLGIALLYLALKLTVNKDHKRHKKKQISWLRRAYEQLQQATNMILWETG